MFVTIKRIDTEFVIKVLSFLNLILLKIQTFKAKLDFMIIYLLCNPVRGTRTFIVQMHPDAILLQSKNSHRGGSSIGAKRLQFNLFLSYQHMLTISVLIQCHLESLAVRLGGRNHHEVHFQSILLYHCVFVSGFLIFPSA